MASFNELVKKKVAGVPVVYLGLAAAVGLALVAWKMKATNTPADTTAPAGDTTAEPDYSGLATTGTVVVAPQQTTVSAATAETNESWMKAAVDYLVNDAKVATVGDAQLAISLYLEGQDLTYEQGKLRDMAVAKLKLPPESLPRVGVTAAAPAQKQFSKFPGKHTVKGSNDNTASKLATLYYGNGDALHANRIVELNAALGPAGTTYSTGTVIQIPAWTTPTYYTVTGKNRDQYATTLAAKFGLTVAMLQALNPSLTFPAKVGTKVRTQ